jgi:peroxiredoxin
LPSLEDLHQHFKDKPFALLSIDVGEKKDVVHTFVRERGLTSRFLLDEDISVSNRYGIRSHPVKFLIDAEGKVIGTAQGYRKWDTEEMKSLIQLLLYSA